MKGVFCIFLALIQVCAGSDAPCGSIPGIKFEKRDDALPTLTLPYGTYQATNYDSNSDIYTWKNIRFAASPTGSLRWMPPASPTKNDTLQDGLYGPSCVQAFPNKGMNFLGPGAESPIGGAANQFLGGIPASVLHFGDEDCLFLDLVVPGKAVRNPSGESLPVVVWIYGGAYLFGSKEQVPDMFYYGGGLVDQSGGSIIYVAGNYRLGAYGWLAGTTMEQQGTPNVGLQDQRAVFQWVQDYAHLFGGDKSQVSAWGESAGAGSILHHLISNGGTQDPLFSKAIVQSPAFEIMFDRRGKLQDSYEIFAKSAGCSDQSLECLRNADASILSTANQALQDTAPDGGFALGPSADGKLVRQLAALEYASGNYWKAIDSLIISHVADEAELFVDGSISTDTEFSSFLGSIFPNYTTVTGINNVIEARYPSISTPGSNYTTITDRVKAFVRDSSFTTNTRFMTDAYAGKTYNMQYSVTPGWHATDLIPLFLNPYIDIDTLNGTLPVPVLPIIGSFAQAYQSYFTSHARTGDPNSHAALLNIPPAIQWGKVGSASAEYYTDVLDAGDFGFSNTTDTQNAKSAADFWVQVQAAVTNAGGYAPPGAVVQQDLVALNGSESVRYETPSS
ncbi:alpha/beta-hydrolase [Viridothelium virens]|uniref:Alpha/beta-hydrolase n=1 Tax=Viridothelium virens TaxID=1048519 RepID=A0A6A6GWJ0_VIRVR|nr:alpha/beta-hydrolase [Viridothelium virens]